MPAANVQCGICGKALHRRPSQLRKSNGNAYCSRQCIDESYVKLRRRMKTCPQCEKEFWARHRSTQTYCSVACSNAARTGMSYGKLGEINHKTKLVFQILEESGLPFRCMVRGCDYDKTLDIHRLKHGKDGGRYTKKNAYLICPNHHAELHRHVAAITQAFDWELVFQSVAENQLEKYYRWRVN